MNKRIKNEKRTMSSKIFFGLGVSFLFIGLSIANAEVLVLEEGWFGGTTSGWDRDATATSVLFWSGVDPASSSLGAYFPEQSIPLPGGGAFRGALGASNGRFSGDYFAQGRSPESFQFKFLAHSGLPSEVWLRFAGESGGTSHAFRALLDDQLGPAGEWQSVTVPLEYDPSVWFGGSAQDFTNALSNVLWVDVRVVRKGAAGQAYFIDDFRLISSVSEAFAGVDTDGDGIPDYWEAAYSGDTTSVVATDDDDADGVSSYDEYRAGTNPYDGDSLLALFVTPTSTGMSVGFDSFPGRNYQLESASSSAPTSWSPVSTPVVGSGARQNISLTPTPQQQLFRLRSIQP